MVVKTPCVKITALFHSFQTVTSNTESSGSFFSQWATHCLPENGKYKSLNLFLPHDQQKVEALLGQFNPGSELRTKYVLRFTFYTGVTDYPVIHMLMYSVICIILP